MTEKRKGDAKPPQDKERDASEETGVSRERPAAGPHAKPELTNPESAPGSGLLPDPERPSETPDSTSG
jgi:hypothetical protein